MAYYPRIKVMFMWIVILCMMIGYGVFRLFRSQGTSRRYLQEAKEEKPLEIGHLSRTLQQFALQTRNVRISLEAPMRAAQELLRPDPMRTQTDLDSIDATFITATREIGDWLYAVENMPTSVQQELADLGIHSEAIRAVLMAEGWAFERKKLRMEGRPSLDIRIQHLMDELMRIEVAIQSPSHIYR